MSLPKNQQEELFTVINELPDFLPEDDPMMVFSKTFIPLLRIKILKTAIRPKAAMRFHRRSWRV